MLFLPKSKSAVNSKLSKPVCTNIERDTKCPALAGHQARLSLLLPMAAWGLTGLGARGKPGTSDRTVDVAVRTVNGTEEVYARRFHCCSYHSGRTVPEFSKFPESFQRIRIVYCRLISLSLGREHQGASTSNRKAYTGDPRWISCSTLEVRNPTIIVELWNRERI